MKLINAINNFFLADEDEHISKSDFMWFYGFYGFILLTLITMFTILLFWGDFNGGIYFKIFWRINYSKFDFIYFIFKNS